MGWLPLGTFVPNGDWTRIDQALQSRLIRVQFLGDAVWLQRYNPRLYFRLWIEDQGHTADWLTLWPQDGAIELVEMSGPTLDQADYLEFRKNKSFTSLQANYQIVLEEYVEDSLPSGAFVDDEFNDGALAAHWQFVDPRGDCSVVVDAAGYLAITVPSGQSHDASPPNNAARVMQTCSNSDFVVSADFLTTPGTNIQFQGFLVEQDVNNWIRFDAAYFAGSLKAYCSICNAGSMNVQGQLNIAATKFLKVSRQGNDWVCEVSLDGTSWQTAASFTHLLSVAQIGVMAGNAGQNPAFTAQVNYFKQT